MKRILVTGGAGFIGSHLVDRLLSSGNAAVTVVDDLNEFYSPAIKRANIAGHIGRDDFEFVQADICDEEVMKKVFSRSRFDCVVHLAARAGVRPSLIDPLAYEKTNVKGPYLLLEMARRSGVEKFVFGSSSSVYGNNSKVPFSESDPLGSPISPYAATKIAGEAACHVYSHLHGIRIMCLRFFTVYGARQRPDLAIHKFTRLIDEGRPVPVFGDGTSRRDYTHIDDIIAGVLAAMEYSKTEYEVINLGESRTVDLAELIRLIEGALGKRAVIDRQAQQPGDVLLTHADVAKARRLLGYNPSTSIETGITKFVEWFKTAASLPASSRAQ